MGLPKLRRSFLVQNFDYLMGLRQFIVGNRSEMELQSAMMSLLTSVNESPQQVNMVSRKTLIKLNQILQLLYDQKWTQLFNTNMKMELRRKNN